MRWVEHVARMGAENMRDDLMGNVGVRWRTILKLISRNYHVRLSSGFIWLMLGSEFWMRKWIFGFHKRWSSLLSVVRVSIFLSQVYVTWSYLLNIIVELLSSPLFLFLCFVVFFPWLILLCLSPSTPLWAQNFPTTASLSQQCRLFLLRDIMGWVLAPLPNCKAHCCRKLLLYKKVIKTYSGSEFWPQACPFPPLSPATEHQCKEKETVIELWTWDVPLEGRGGWA